MIFRRLPGILREGYERNHHGMRTLAMWLILGVAVTALGIAVAVEASQSPPDCTTDAVSLGIQVSPKTIINGQTVTFMVTLGNGPFPACDAGQITIQGFCPDSTGNPTIPSQLFNITTLAAGTPTFDVGSFQCKVTVDPVTTATGSDVLNGVLHNDPASDAAISITQTASVSISAVPPSQIPTLSGPVMALLAVFLAVAGAVALSRKRAV